MCDPHNEIIGYLISDIDVIHTFLTHPTFKNRINEIICVTQIHQHAQKNYGTIKITHAV